MKLGILSDLHIEFGNFNPLETDADVVVLAGDIHIGDQGIDWAVENFKEKEVIYVIGNHEYYHGEIPEVTEKIRAKAAGTNVHVLENEEFIMGQVRFLGCTLWTDFELFNHPDMDALKAQRMMNDFKIIHLNSEKIPLGPLDTVKWHNQTKQWLAEKTIPSPNDKLKTVVVTHHAPSSRSVPERYKGDHLSAAFASEMSNLILDKQIDLWVHGHVHDSFDYRIGKTRIICNPRGYVPNELNGGFIADLSIEV